MNILKTEFEGLILIELKSFEDNRGFFYETWREKDYQQIGIKEKFLQDNTALSKKNVLRGLHSQINQGQLVTVVHGKIFDVVVDIRPSSKTYKKYFSIELDSLYPKQIYMPPGFSHGLYVLSDFAIINYKCTQYYNPSFEKNFIWNDSSFKIDWPQGEKIISKKDQNFPSLEQN